MPAKPTRGPFRAAIIGGGVSGICAAIRLQQVGFGDFVILERSERLGGTWRDNTYPGAACDVPAHLYSFSFAPSSTWSRKFASQPEILAYLERCASDFAIMDRVRTGANVVDAAFDEAAKCWTVRLEDGETVGAHILIAATGQLCVPQLPEIAGRDRFAGASFHSARWRHDCDLAGKSVAIVGSAASTVQIAPKIAPAVGALTIFQRSPNWIAPLPDHTYSERTQRAFRRLPLIRRLYRWYLYARQELLIVAFRSDGRANRMVKAGLRMKMGRKIADRAKRRMLIPDYAPGCKRILRAPDYLRLVSGDGATVVGEEIERIVGNGLITRSGKLHEADVIVYATGFAASDFLAPLEVRGRGGIRLHDAWSDGPEAYLGMTMPGFPNFFMLYGPNTSLGHNSVILMIERQCNYVVRMLRRMAAKGASSCEVRPEALERYRARLTAGLAGTVWTSGCRSYYTAQNGRVVSIWPFSTLRYWLETRRPRLSDYVIGQ